MKNKTDEILEFVLTAIIIVIIFLVKNNYDKITQWYKSHTDNSTELVSNFKDKSKIQEQKPAIPINIIKKSDSLSNTIKEDNDASINDQPLPKSDESDINDFCRYPLSFYTDESEIKKDIKEYKTAKVGDYFEGKRILRIKAGSGYVNMDLEDGYKFHFSYVKCNYCHEEFGCPFCNGTGFVVMNELYREGELPYNRIAEMQKAITNRIVANSIHPEAHMGTSYFPGNSDAQIQTSPKESNTGHKRCPNAPMSDYQSIYSGCHGGTYDCGKCSAWDKVGNNDSVTSHQCPNCGLSHSSNTHHSCVCRKCGGKGYL